MLDVQLDAVFERLRNANARFEFCAEVELFPVVIRKTVDVRGVAVSKIARYPVLVFQVKPETDFVMVQIEKRFENDLELSAGGAVSGKSYFRDFPLLCPVLEREVSSLRIGVPSLRCSLERELPKTAGIRLCLLPRCTLRRLREAKEFF